MANSDSKSTWGGSWTEQKLDCFESYVRAYLTIMNKYRDRFEWHLVYFDGFAGSGDRGLRKEGEDRTLSLWSDEVSAQDLRVYQGAAERVIALEGKTRGFDLYYFVDHDQDNLNKLKLKLDNYPKEGKCFYLPWDANVAINALAKMMCEDARKIYIPGRPQHLKTLCLLDPFGMDIEWKSIEKLAGNSLDLWILVPTGAIISRLIQNDGTLRSPQLLERFFGLSAEVLEKRFYYREVAPGLFGDVERTTKVSNIITEIANLYCEQLGTLFKFVTNKPLVMKNSKNVPIFHFVCASNNETAVKIAAEIIEKRQR